MKDAGYTRGDWTELFSLTYLALPNVIFFMGWLHPGLAVPLVVLLLISVWHGAAVDSRYVRPPSSIAVLFLLFAAFAWASLGGAGHFFYANPDWKTRDAVFADLIVGKWPLAYVEHGQTVLLRSAFAYFLPSALIVKLAGTDIAQWALFAWTALGTFLFLRCLPIHGSVGWRLFGALLIVILFSGMDWLGVLLVSGDLPMFPLRLEWWTKFSYSSLSGQLFWAPNHVLPIWLASALCLRNWQTHHFLRVMLPTVTLSSLWTPFAPVALAPYLILHWSIAKGIQQTRATRLQWIFSIVWLSVLGLFFLLPYHGSLEIVSGVTHSGSESSFVRDYLIFVLCEFAILMFAIRKLANESKSLFYVSGGILFTLPFVLWGPSNDLMLRCSIPPLIFFLWTLLNSIQQASSLKAWIVEYWLAVSILLIGAMTPIHEIARSITWNRWKPDYLTSLQEVQGGQLPPHYGAKLSNTWFQLLAKEPHIVPVGSQRLLRIQ